jgi:hypothetical protein
VCSDCDVGLNKLALEYIGFPNAEELWRTYAQGIEAGTGEPRFACLDAKHESPVGNADAPNPITQAGDEQ